MEGHSTTSQVQVMPRLRLTRQSLSVSGAGPSQTSTRLGAQADLSDDLRASYSVDGDEDEESTPRRAPSDALHPMDDVVEGDGSRSEATPTADTPANRLRALLARSPGSATPTQRFVGRNTAEGNGPSTSQLDYATATPKHPFSPPLEEPPASVARESLRDLFAHALRDPGDTPVKEGRTRRRNSFGSSGISGSPVRTRTRTKRMSFSDEEIDHMSKRDIEDMSLDVSQRSSQAAVYDSLRARLANATLSPGPPSSTRDTLDDLDLSPPAEPLASFSIPTKASATSTPLRQSVSQFPSLYSASNLLGEDSGMQKAIKDLDSDATEDEGKAATTNSAHQNNPDLPKSLPHSTFRRSLSRQASMESIGSTFSRSSSRQSVQRTVTEVDEKLKERERGWNRPMNAYINGQMSQGLRRSGSTASLLSSDGRQSPASSVGSSHDRSHMAAGLDILHSRTRTLSQPSLPSSASTVRVRKDSPTARPSSSLSQRRLSQLFHSPQSPRPGSPALSVSSHASSQEDVESHQLRERNWNSPRQKWNPYSDKQVGHERRRSDVTSPIPNLRAGENRSARRTSWNGPVAQTTPAISRSEELDDALMGNDEPQATSPADKRKSVSRSPVPAASSSSPNSSKLPTPSRRSEWTFPRSRSTHHRAPHDSASDAHEPQTHERQRTLSSPAPVPTPTSRSGDNTSARSLLPIRVNGAVHSPQARTERRNLHKRSITEYNESVGSIPPKVSFAAEPVVLENLESDNTLTSDAESDDSHTIPDAVGGQQVTTHTEDSVENAPAVPVVKQDSDPHIKDDPERISTPPSPSIMLPGGLQATPKRNRLGNLSMVEFHTPSPPRGMPDLPDPPSSDELDSDRTPPARTPNPSLNARIAAMRTPRPPGAWMTPSATPAAPMRSEFNPSVAQHSLADDRQARTPASRTFSMIAPTPAPPGAWIATPANLKKRSMQKVRFDNESATADSENDGFVMAGSRLRESHTIPDLDQNSERNNQAECASEGLPDPTTSIPRTPPRASRPIRHSPGIRLVDEFGKEIMTDEVDSRSEHESASKQHASDLERKDLSLGKKGMLRVVDAMGREVQDDSMDLSDKVVPYERSGLVAVDSALRGNQEQTKDIIHKTLAELQDDLNHLDSSNVPDDFLVRVEKLEQRSQAARLQRENILRRIQSSAGADGQTAKFARQLLQRRDVKRIRTLFHLNSWAVWICLIIQIIILLVLYRLLTLGARHLFLTTYYDPIYSELYLHVTEPWQSDLPKSAHPLSYNFSHSETFVQQRRSTWSQVFMSSWNNLVDVVFSIQRDRLNTREFLPRSGNWPPT